MTSPTTSEVRDFIRFAADSLARQQERAAWFARQEARHAATRAASRHWERQVGSHAGFARVQNGLCFGHRTDGCRI